MTSFDIAMAMGGTEAIVESFYSVMDTQKQVRQHHVTLEDRTILDWATSNVLNSEDIIAKAAKFYVDGSMAKPRLSRHRVGNLKRKSRDSYKASFNTSVSRKRTLSIFVMNIGSSRLILIFF